MNTQRKAAGGEHPQAAQNTSFSFNFSPVRSWAKTAVVQLAIRNIVPTGLADWLIQNGGLKHE